MKRTQAERTEATVTALVDAARELFATDGYESTSLAAVAVKAGVSKGAVYHHFGDGKRQLFRAVFAQEVERMAGPVANAYAGKKDPWDAFNAGCRAFLNECLRPDVQRLVLLDASAAIGWEEMRQLEAPLLKMMTAGISTAAAAGRIAPRSPGPLAHFLFGALCETAMVVARADDKKAAHRLAITEINRILAGLASA
jgi:AcrR family transcriptional regulator